MTQAVPEGDGQSIQATAMQLTKTASVVQGSSAFD